MSMTWVWGAQIFMGRPGKPAPDPKSTRKPVAGKGELAGTEPKGETPAAAPAPVLPGLAGRRWRAAKKDSPKWRVMISCGVRMAVRFTRAFQRIRRSMYV